MSPPRIRSVVISGLLFTVFLGTCLFLGQNDARPPALPLDDEAIRHAFEQYRTAILADDGQAAVQWVDSETVDWYGEAANQAVTLPEAELEQQPFSRMYTILRLRTVLNRTELETMTGEDVFAYFVDQGWVRPKKGSTTELGRIWSDGVTASASIAPNMKQPAFSFSNDHGRWKLSLSKGIPHIDSMMDDVIAEEGLTKEEFVIKILERATGKPVDLQIFAGPLDN